MVQSGRMGGRGGGLRDNLALSTESRMGIGHRKKISTVSIDSFDDFPYNLFIVTI